tara:strand:- start:39 stop:593 length:555 start_codon:yes stop_codon:yes gene_type:complete
MDPELYCKPENSIPYGDFIDDLCGKNVILIGEDHISGLEVVDGKYDFETTLNGVDFKNERLILEDLLARGKTFRFAGEAIDGYRSPRKRTLISQFNFEDPIHLDADSCSMAETLRPYLSTDSVVAIVGDFHIHWTKELLRAVNPELKISTVSQNNEISAPEGIYPVHSMTGTDYIVKGLLCLSS